MSHQRAGKNCLQLFQEHIALLKLNTKFNSQKYVQRNASRHAFSLLLKLSSIQYSVPLNSNKCYVVAYLQD